MYFNLASTAAKALPLIAGMTLRTLPRVLAAAWLGLACYCLLSLFLGKGGMLASTSSAAELASMRSNLESLHALNEGLSIEIAALQNDPDRARREALPLGWLAKGDFEIVLADRSLPSRKALSAGTVLPASKPAGLADMDIKATSFLVGLLALVLSLIRDRNDIEKRLGLRKKQAKDRLDGRKRRATGKPSTAAAETPIAGSLA